MMMFLSLNYDGRMVRVNAAHVLSVEKAAVRANVWVVHTVACSYTARGAPRRTLDWLRGVWETGSPPSLLDDLES